MRLEFLRMYPLLLIVIAALYIYPVFMSPVSFTLHLAFLLCLYITLAQAFNLMAGFTGYMTLGHSAFFGIGAYTTAVLALNGVSPYLGMLVGGMAAVAFVFLIYPVLFTLKGAYFAISTMLVLRILAILMTQPFIGLGGSEGLPLPQPVEFSRIPYYYVSLTQMLVTSAIAMIMLRSKLGLGMRAIREDEDAALYFGVPTLKLKLVAVAISAFFTSIAGGLYASYTFYVHPEVVFAIMLSLQIQFMPIVGGLGTILGPIIGALIVFGLSETFTYTLGELSLFVYGASAIGVMLFLPEGVWGVVREKLRLECRIFCRKVLRASVLMTNRQCIDELKLDGTQFGVNKTKKDAIYLFRFRRRYELVMIKYSEVGAFNTKPRQ